MDEAKTFSDFSDVVHIPLRIFNRSATAFNILEDYGKHQFQIYINQFDEIEKNQIGMMYEYILQYGYEAGKRFATRGLEFTDE